MLLEPRSSSVPSFAPIQTPRTDINSSSAEAVIKDTYPLVFGSWLPGDFDILAAIASGKVPKDLPASTADPSTSSSACVPPAQPLQYTHTASQPLAYLDSAAGAADMPFGPNAGTLLQPQVYQSPAPPLFLVPVASPVFVAPVADASSCLPRAAAANMAAAPTWGLSPDVDAGQPSYPFMSYNRNTGFWLQGFFFTSYEHLMAYRRCAIAYNYHFFGIRPHFRPPADLPRPRAGAPLAAAGLGSSAIGNGDADGCSTDKVGEDGECFCCSPGGSSTCSNGDSDEIGSDLSRGETDTELLCDSQHAAIGLHREARDPTADTSKVAAARSRISSGLESVAQRLAGLPTAPLAQGAGCILPRLGSLLVDWTAYAAAAASLAAAGPGPGASQDHASQGEAGDGLSRHMHSACTAATSPLPVSPLRCHHVSSGPVTSGDVQGDPHSSPCTAAGASPTASACPQWLEPHLGAMLDRVVGEALWGFDEAT